MIVLNNFTRKNKQPQDGDSSDDQFDDLSNEEVFELIISHIYSLVA